MRANQYAIAMPRSPPLLTNHQITIATLRSTYITLEGDNYNEQNNVRATIRCQVYQTA